MQTTFPRPRAQRGAISGRFTASSEIEIEKLTRVGAGVVRFARQRHIGHAEAMVSSRLSSSQNIPAFSCTVQPAPEVPRRPLAFLLIHIWK